MKYRKKEVIEAITFEDFVQHGLENTDNIVNGMPWSFMYKEWGITHANDECYLIPTIEGELINFTLDDMLVTEEDGGLIAIKKSVFEAIYEAVD